MSQSSMLIKVQCHRDWLMVWEMTIGLLTLINNAKRDSNYGLDFGHCVPELLINSIFKNSLSHFQNTENLKMIWKTGKNTYILPSFFILVAYLILPVSSKDQYVEPLLFGMKASIPYDMANLFNRFPFQGGLAVILGLGLAGILFFGVITSPFGYMFGVPSEKYVLGDFALKHPEVEDPNFNPNVHRRMSLEPPEFPMASPRSSSSVLLDYVRSVKGSPRKIFSDQQSTEPCCQTFLHYFDSIVEYLDYWEPAFPQSWKPSLSVLRNRLGGKIGKEIVTTVESTLGSEYTPEFIESMFYLISEKERDIRNPSCQLRMVCHAHGVLHHLPPLLLKIYHKFR